MYPVDNPSVKTATELLKTQAASQVKQHIVYDSASRPYLAFTAYIGAKEGDPCLVTEYVYLTASSTQVISRQERVYQWNAAWDANFTFDPAVVYDADGDGVL